MIPVIQIYKIGKGMVCEMTIEEMTAVSYILLAFAIILGIVTVVLFFTLKIPKAHRAVKGQRKHKRKKRITGKTKDIPKTVKLEESFMQEGETVLMAEDKVHFTILQDITYVHAEEEL